MNSTLLLVVLAFILALAGFGISYWWFMRKLPRETRQREPKAVRRAQPGN